MKQFNNLSTIYIILLLGFIGGIFLTLFTQISYGGGDSTQHYNLAHWGWIHPKLLFNHWGKPIFTILMSPMAQFGIDGARLFNLIMGTGTAIIIWKIAQTLKFNNSALSIILVLFTPVYFILMFTPLTEVSFSFFLALSILLFFKKKYYISAIILSLTPLIRTEGIVLLPLFITAYILRKKVLAIPLIFTGFIIISILGYPYFDDFWWLITKMPYSGGAKDIYGSGSLFHFINETRSILGYPIAVLFIIGLTISIFNWGKNEKYKINNTFFFLLLVPASYLIFLSAHSFVWWQGMGNSLGLIRVIGSVTPLAALTALLGFNLITESLNKLNKITYGIVIYGIVSLILILGTRTHRSGFKLSKEQQLVDQATTFLKESNLHSNKTHFFDPFAVFKLGIDPYNTSASSWGVPNKENPSFGIADSSIIIWDAHFGPNEGRVSLEALQKQKSFSTIKVFKPEKPFTVLGGYNYEIHIFMKDISLVDELKTRFRYDFESDIKSDSTIAYTGTKSKHVISNMLYTIGVDAYLQDVLYSPDSFMVVTKGYIYVEKPIDKELPIVCSLEDGDGSHHYETNDLRTQITKFGEWNHFKYRFKVNNVNSLNEHLKVYIWNKNKSDFYLDDFEINILTSNNNDSIAGS